MDRYGLRRPGSYYPRRMQASIYPGSVPVVGGIISVADVSGRRLDAVLEVQGEALAAHFNGGTDLLEAILFLLKEVLEKVMTTVVYTLHGQSTTVIASSFGDSVRDRLFEGNLIEKTDFSGFNTPGKVYVTFSQIEY